VVVHSLGYNVATMNVGVREFRSRLSAYLARVRQGETVVVTDHGTPVARLERVAADQPPAAVRRLVDAGLLTYKPPPRRFPKPIRLLPGNKTSTDYIAEQRR
jgi:antitoxin (DNA-binding transcriptional repressor) of toxin-antitoxin stability system